MLSTWLDIDRIFFTLRQSMYPQEEITMVRQKLYTLIRTFMIERSQISRPVWGITVVGVLWLMSPPGWAGTPLFTNQTVAAGVSFTHMPLADTPGVPMHGGGAVGDFNNDGWPDLFVVGGGGTPDRLFINQGNGTFVDAAAAWGLGDLYRGNSATSGDYNHDGCIDLFVTSYGDLPGPPVAGQHRLYRNNCDGTFTNVAAAAGVNETAPYPDGFGATFGDYDLDGDLDLWVGGWMLDTGLPQGPGRALGTRLFRNNGNGTFTDVTVAAGVVSTQVRGFGAIFADMDGDRYPELLVAGDFGTSLYFINNRNGTFTRGLGGIPVTQLAWNGMGTTVADINRDGRLDWLVTAIFPAWHNEGPPGSRLYINDGNHQFHPLPGGGGVNNGGWGWGASALDFDHDGWIDLVHTNGWPEIDQVTGGDFRFDQTRLFRNNGNETFTEVALLYGLDHNGQGRGLLLLDYDQDGDLDVVNLTNGGPLFLFRNDLTGPGTNWLEVVLDTSAHVALPPNGWGSNVTLTRNGVTQTQRLTNGSNYLSNSEWLAHFGMASAPTATLTVEWVDGFRTVLMNVAANQRLTVVAEEPYSSSAAIAGEPIEFVVQGLRPGEVARFGVSAATGAGTCSPMHGGLCGDLVEPVTILGTATANADGVATLVETVSLDVAGQTWYSQALIRRGIGGNLSLKTNVITHVVP
jgi:hypothetical protein